MKKITIVDHAGGDWTGMYLDNKLVLEGHSLNWWEILNILKIEYEEIEADENWMYENGNLPKDLKDVQLAQEGEQ